MVIVKPPYPSVPDLPGVPHLPRSPNFPVVVQSILGLIEGQIWQILNSGPIWGIVNANGQRVLDPDSIMAFAYRNESKIASFPVQDGAFASYNKVASPFETVVRVTKGGNVNDRQVFLDTLDMLSRTTDLYSVITPEVVYLNVNIAGYDYQRTAANGAYMIIADIRLVEIRRVAPQYTTVSQQTVNAQQPSAVPPQSQGRVQSAEPQVSILKQITNGLGRVLE